MVSIFNNIFFLFIKSEGESRITWWYRKWTHQFGVWRGRIWQRKLVFRGPSAVIAMGRYLPRESELFFCDRVIVWILKIIFHFISFHSLFKTKSHINLFSRKIVEFFHYNFGFTLCCKNNLILNKNVCSKKIHKLLWCWCIYS